MSTKMAQVENAILRFLTHAIHDLRDPRIPLIVTVEAVRVTADLQQAKVFVSTLGDMQGLLAALEHARGFLQKQLSRELDLRRTPALSFYSAEDAISSGWLH